MGERKVINKYYPPDFDPSKVPRQKKPRDRQTKVRLMVPFTMRCLRCGEYLIKGTKFNAMKEEVIGEDYLGIKIWRFYIRCRICSSEVTFKTDPKNTDYVCESGAKRGYEPVTKAEQVGTIEDQEAAEAAEVETKNNPMAALEARTEQSRQEMETLEALEDLRDSNARTANVDLDALIARTQQGTGSAAAQAAAQLARAEAEDEAIIQKVFGQHRGSRIRRLTDEPLQSLPSPTTATTTATTATTTATRAAVIAGSVSKTREKRGSHVMEADIAPISTMGMGATIGTATFTAAAKRARQQGSNNDNATNGSSSSALTGLIKRRKEPAGPSPSLAAHSIKTSAQPHAFIKEVPAASSPTTTLGSLGALAAYGGESESSEGE